jgi:hypothetical protein
MKKITWTSNRKRNLASQRQDHGVLFNTIELAVIANQKALREMTPEQRQKKQADDATLKFLGISP